VLFLIALALHQERESLTDDDDESDEKKTFSFSRSAAEGEFSVAYRSEETRVYEVFFRC